MSFGMFIVLLFILELIIIFWETISENKDNNDRKKK